MLRIRKISISYLIFIIIILSACGQQIGKQESEPDKVREPIQQLNEALEHSEIIQDNIEHKKHEEFPQNHSNHKKDLKKDKNSLDNKAKKDRMKVPLKVKGIYVSGWIAGSKRMDNLIRMVDDTEINAMVIDVKNDTGEITYDSNIPLVNELQSDRRKMISNIHDLMKKLEDKNIYTIARLVVFKDPYLAAKKQEWAIHYKSGKMWRDQKGVSWVNPYQEEVWNYNLNIAKEAAELGFDEVQFDYVRFPDNGKKLDQEVQFNQTQGRSKAQLISEFLNTATKTLHERDVFVSADVFGLTTSTKDDMGIGQDWSKITQAVDYISPMIYPSHYSSGMYGLTHPDLKPYETVKKALKDGKKKNQILINEQKATAVIRPWIQSFTATWIHPHLTYEHEEIKLQIKAAQEQGIDEYLLWNPKCEYTFK